MPSPPKPKPRPVGRPKLHDRAKSSTLLVRFSPEDRLRVEQAAHASDQTVSEWIRGLVEKAVRK
jgi:predicted HicB family RNase H-like nuclease